MNRSIDPFPDQSGRVAVWIKPGVEMPIHIVMGILEFLLGWSLVSVVTALVVGPLLAERPQPRLAVVRITPPAVVEHSR